MKKWTKEQKEQLKLFWNSAKESEDRFREQLDAIEKVMQESIGVPDLEFFWDDFGCMAGIGNWCARKKDKYELWEGE